MEEKIDGMLEEKSKLSDEVIPGTGEIWITEMKNDGDGHVQVDIIKKVVSCDLSFN